MKEKKVSEKANRDPGTEGFNPDSFFMNRLSLPQSLKDKLTAEGLDWRFINANQFRQSGGMHTSHWVPYKFSQGEFGSNAEGILQRGDVILATRPKAVTVAHKDYLKKRNDALSRVNKQHATELKKQLGAAGAKVYEGYDEND